VGVEIPEQQEDSAEIRARRKERAEVLAACDAAARYFQARLWSRYGEAGRSYLEGRGVTEEAARLFRLGVAAPGWNDLERRLAEKGVGKAALTKAGLRIEKDGGGYDRFRGRLMIPIAGLDGQVDRVRRPGAPRRAGTKRAPSTSTARRPSSTRRARCSTHRPGARVRAQDPQRRPGRGVLRR